MTDTVVDRAEEILEHAGVKGMKWGVRKGRSDGSANKSSTPKPGARTYDPKKLSNDDLKKVVARMKLEQEYTTLNKKTTSEGKKIAHEILKAVPKTVVLGALSIVTGKLVKDMLEGGNSPFKGGGSPFKGFAANAATAAARRKNRGMLSIGPG